MRLKILLIGDDPASLATDVHFLRERGLMVYSTFNLGIIDELVAEIHPDVVFFDSGNPCNAYTDAYNDMVNSFDHAGLPVLFTLAEDDVYLVTRSRTGDKNKRTLIADNIVDAVKMALSFPAANRKTNKKHANINPGNLSAFTSGQMTIAFHA